MSLPNYDTSFLNVVDFIALGIIALSILIGLIRGFTREILGARAGWARFSLLFGPNHFSMPLSVIGLEIPCWQI